VNDAHIDHEHHASGVARASQCSAEAVDETSPRPAASAPSRERGSMAICLFVGAPIGTAVFGFLVGLFLFKVKSRWCPECGATTAALELRPVAPTTAGFGRRTSAYAGQLRRVPTPEPTPGA
jgi:hypothetical protein